MFQPRPVIPAKLLVADRFLAKANATPDFILTQFLNTLAAFNLDEGSTVPASGQGRRLRLVYTESGLHSSPDIVRHCSEWTFRAI
jgi:hypothetical protein